MNRPPLKRHLAFATTKPPFAPPDDYHSFSVSDSRGVADQEAEAVVVRSPARNQKVGEKPLLSISTFMQAARSNALLAIPAFLYAINNYLKFTMQLYFNPATVKMLSNLKVLVIAVLLKVIMKRRFFHYSVGSSCSIAHWYKC